MPGALQTDPRSQAPRMPMRNVERASALPSSHRTVDKQHFTERKNQTSSVSASVYSKGSINPSTPGVGLMNFLRTNRNFGPE